MSLPADVVKQSDPRIADWLRSRREERELTQEQVVDRVRRAGAKLSRGHLSNFEAAAYAPAPSLVAVLDLVLDGDGDLVALAEKVLNVQIKTPLRAEVISFARRIHEGLPGWAEDAHLISEVVEDRIDVAPPDSPRRRASARGSRVPASVVQGRNEVEAAVCQLLLEAASRTPREGKDILLCGTFLGFRKDPRKPGLPHAVRQALRRTLEQGWDCRHFVPAPPESGPAAAALVYITAPLMPCPRYTPLLIDRGGPPTTDNLLLIPGIASVAFQTGSGAVIDAAIIHESRDEASRLIAKKIDHINSFSKKFVHHERRQHRRESPALTADELWHRESLNKMSAIEGPARLVVDRWPTSTIPPPVYSALIDRRREAARKAFDQGNIKVEVASEEWKRMVELQEERFLNFETHLRERFPYQIIVTPTSLRLPARKESHWKALNLEERNRHFDYVRQMLDKYKNFQIGVASDPLAQRIEKCRWEVHEKTPDGVVHLETHYTPGLNQNEWRPGEECRVDLEIRAPAAVQSFGAYFKHVWLQTEPLTPQRLGTAV